jgi:hypothetical protein
MMWMTGKTREETYSKTNINTNNDRGVDEFAKKLAVAETENLQRDQSKRQCE